jgi:hypothetical protein
MKQKLLFLIGCASLYLITGCATPYQSNSFRGGFSETQLSPDTFRVYFRGNGYTSGERAQDFTLLRASELTIQHGFTCFAILDEKNSTTSSSFTTSGYANTTAYGTGYSSGNVYLNQNGGTYNGTTSTYVNANTTYTPPQTYVIHRPQAGLSIKCFASKPDGVQTLDAAFLQQSLKQKYNIHV